MCSIVLCFSLRYLTNAFLLWQIYAVSITIRIVVSLPCLSTFELKLLDHCMLILFGIKFLLNSTEEKLPVIFPCISCTIYSCSIGIIRMDPTILHEGLTVTFFPQY